MQEDKSQRKVTRRIEGRQEEKRSGRKEGTHKKDKRKEGRHTKKRRKAGKKKGRK